MASFARAGHKERGGGTFATFSATSGRRQTDGGRAEGFRGRTSTGAVWSEKLVGVVGKCVRKGGRVLVAGSLHYSAYTKAGRGHPRADAGVTVARIQLLGRPDTWATTTRGVGGAGVTEGILGYEAGGNPF